MNAMQNYAVQTMTAPQIEERLNMPGFILWARENLIPNKLAVHLTFSGGGYRELSNVVSVTDWQGLLIDKFLTDWAQAQSNPDNARKIAKALYEYGRGETSTAKILSMHRNTIRNYRLSAMNFLWSKRVSLGLEE